MDYSSELLKFQTEYRGLAKDRQAFDTKLKNDREFAADIETLYKRFVGTFRRYCGNCWHDAFIHLLTLKHMENKSQFRLLSGTLLFDPVNRDTNYMLTPQMLARKGDDLALRHLAHNPEAIEYFEKPLPENLNEMIADYLRRERGEVPVEAEKTEAEATQDKTAAETEAQPEQTGEDAEVPAEAEKTEARKSRKGRRKAE